MTSLSTGLLIYDVLAGDTGVRSLTDTIFPVVAEDDAKLPYICYRRSTTDEVPVKSQPGADTCTVDILCYAATYAGSIELAEAVREALDGAQAEYVDTAGGKLVARSIQMIDSEEGWGEDAYLQTLTFAIRIN